MMPGQVARRVALASLMAGLAACGADSANGTGPSQGPGSSPRAGVTPRSIDGPNAVQPAGIPASHGYGAITAGGATELSGLGREVCTVTTLADAGPGSLRDCVLNRQRPREVRFAVAGTIMLKRASGMIVIRQPYLTINGFSAPPPGVTLAKDVECFNAMRIGATHDVVIVGLRFRGNWKPGDSFPNRSCADANNTNTLGVDGDTNAEAVPWDPQPNDRANPSDLDGQAGNARGVRRLVVAYNTFANGHDSNPDYWGDIVDATHQANLVIESWHPSTVSYQQTSPRRFPRQRLSWYANVYARNGERQPQLVNGVFDFDMRDNVIHGWFQPGGGGYGLRFKGGSGDLPTSPANVIHNAFLAAGSDPDKGCVFGEQPRREEGPDSRVGAMRLFFQDNLFPEGRSYADSNCVTTPSARDGAYAVPARARLPALDWQDAVRRVGMPYRTPEEQALLEEIATALRARQ